MVRYSRIINGLSDFSHEKEWNVYAEVCLLCSNGTKRKSSFRVEEVWFCLNKGSVERVFEATLIDGGYLGI